MRSALQSFHRRTGDQPYVDLLISAHHRRWNANRTGSAGVCVAPSRMIFCLTHCPIQMRGQIYKLLSIAAQREARELTTGIVLRGKPRRTVSVNDGVHIKHLSYLDGGKADRRVFHRPGQPYSERIRRGDQRTGLEMSCETTRCSPCFPTRRRYFKSAGNGCTAAGPT